jgi:membrane protein
LNGPKINAIFGLVWTSSGTIDGIRVVFNRAYNLEAKKHYILNRLFSAFQFILISIITILILFFFHIFIPFIVEYEELFSEFNQRILKIPNFLNNIFFYSRYILNISILFFYILWLNFFLPDNEIRKKYSIYNLIPGAFVTIFLWFLTTKILKFYFSKFLQFNIIYGSLANIISILLFFYVIFLCLIFGAEMNYFYNLSSKNKS